MKSRISEADGLCSRAGVQPLSFTLDLTGPMAWTTQDCALLLQAMAEHDPADPASADHPVARGAAASPEMQPDAEHTGGISAALLHQLVERRGDGAGKVHRLHEAVQMEELVPKYGQQSMCHTAGGHRVVTVMQRRSKTRAAASIADNLALLGLHVRRASLSSTAATAPETIDGLRDL